VLHEEPAEEIGMAKWLGGGNLVPPGALCHCRDFRPNGPGEAGRWRTDRTDDAARRGVEGHRLVVADYPSTADAATHFRLIAQVRDQRPERVYRRDTAGDRRIREPVQCLDQKVVEIWVSLLRPEAEDNLGEQRCAREGGQVVSDALTATKQGEAGEASPSENGSSRAPKRLPGRRAPFAMSERSPKSGVSIRRMRLVSP
jgi:hypothetical protein